MSELKDESGNVKPEVENGDFRPSSGGGRFYVGSSKTVYPVSGAAFAAYDEATGTYGKAQPIRTKARVTFEQKNMG